jgi:TPR repeat protein
LVIEHDQEQSCQTVKLRRAIAAIGALYLYGRGVTQDDVRAHMWFNLSAAQVSKERSRL